MFFKELDNEARRRLIDTQQRSDALRASQVDLKRRFAGSMIWKDRGGRDYLYRRHGRVEKSLGPRSAETEAIYEAYSRTGPGQRCCDDARAGMGAGRSFR